MAYIKKYLDSSSKQIKDKLSHSDFAGQNIMAAILQNLPNEAELTKIEYEGPRIALYSTNPTYLLKNAQTVSNMVNTIKKRIVVRIDESLRQPEKEATETIKKTLSHEMEITNILYDPALGEATVFVEKPSKYKTDEIPADIRLAEEIGWRVEIKKTPNTYTAIEAINRILKKTMSQRIRFHKEVGEKIFRSKLNDLVEANLVTLGGFGETGRSSILLSTHESRIMLDCGLNLSSEEPVKRFPRFDILGFNLDELDAIVLSHAHLDHTGFLPMLFKFGFDGPIYCSDPTLPLMYILQSEYLRNLKSDAQFSVRDIEQVVVHTFPLPFDIVTDISPDVKLTLCNAGHILGSALLHLHIGNGDHNLLYTGDMRYARNEHLENAVWNFPRVETIVIEGTYGDKEAFPRREVTNNQLIDEVNETISKGGTVLFPVPSVGLTQELMLIIKSYMQAGRLNKAKMLVERIIWDAASIYEIFPEYLSRELGKRVLSIEDKPFRDEFVFVDSVTLGEDPTIIFSPSSMLIGGPSVNYLEQISDNPLNKVILTAFQAAGTPGRLLRDGGREISVCGKDLKIKCQVQTVEGFSPHCDHGQTIAYVSKIRHKLRRILVNQGEKSSIHSLASSLNRSFKLPAQHPAIQESIRLV
jgi:KH/beta-lactamase-domain protein